LKIDNNPFAKGFRETGQSRCKRKIGSSSPTNCPLNQKISRIDGKSSAFSFVPNRDDCSKSFHETLSNGTGSPTIDERLINQNLTYLHSSSYPIALQRYHQMFGINSQFMSFMLPHINERIPIPFSPPNSNCESPSEDAGDECQIDVMTDDVCSENFNEKFDQNQSIKILNIPQRSNFSISAILGAS
jgi:hypothetical protein